jgi:hypothetical protein
MFTFDQQGGKGLCPPWNRESHVSALLSDLFFSMGHISRSRRMAVETNVCAKGAGNPRMLQRLVQTSLIYGAYPVAEKYIFLLEQTRNYKAWAQEQRLFLWNEEAIEQDSVLGLKRKCIPRTDFMEEVNSLETELLQIAGQNPAHKATLHYAGALYLLAKNLDGFKNLIDTCYGRDSLPELPRSFQEAVLILPEQNPEYAGKFQLPESTLRRYDRYRQAVLANQSPALPEPDFEDTYWFYYMYKKTE